MAQPGVTEQSPDDGAVVSMTDPAPLLITPPSLSQTPRWDPLILPPFVLLTVPIALDALRMKAPVRPVMTLPPSLVTVPPSSRSTPLRLPTMELAPRLLTAASLPEAYTPLLMEKSYGGASLPEVIWPPL